MNKPPISFSAMLMSLSLLFVSLLFLSSNVGGTLTSLEAQSSPLIPLVKELELGEMGDQVLLKIDSMLSTGEDGTDAVIALEAMSKAKLEKPSRHIWTFGDGRKGQLGHGTYEVVTVPRMVHYLTYTVVMRVACGQEHMIACSDTNNTYTWGQGNQGQLSDRLFSGVRPHWSAGIRNKKIQNVFAGGWNSMAIDDAQSIYSWGWHKFGQLGRESKETAKPDKIGAPLMGKKVVSVAVGLAHALVAVDSGEAYAFGANMYGQIGDGGTKATQLPKAVKALEGMIVKQVAAGCEHSLALIDDGTVFSWGNGHMGQLGQGDWASSGSPRKVPGTLPLGKGMFVAAGCHHSVLSLDNQLVVAWGWNRWGQLGTGDTLNRPTPRLANLFRGQIGVRSLVAGRRHTLLLSDRNQVFCWGCNKYGQCGMPRPTYLKEPVQVAFFDNLGARQISANADYSAVITDSIWAAWTPGTNITGAIDMIDASDNRRGIGRAHIPVTRAAAQALIEADRFAEEAAVDRDASIGSFQKAEAKFEADIRVAKERGVSIDVLLGLKTENPAHQVSEHSGWPFVPQDKVVPQAVHVNSGRLVAPKRSVNEAMAPVHALQVKDEDPMDEGEGGAADQKTLNEARDKQDTADSTKGTLGEDSTRNKDPPSLDELKGLGPIASDELQGEEIAPPLPSPSPLPDASPPPQPLTAPLLSSMFFKWFAIKIFQTADCNGPFEKIHGNRTGICVEAPDDPQLSLRVQPSVAKSGFLDLYAHTSTPLCEISQELPMLATLSCGEECISRKSMGAATGFYTVTCGLARPEDVLEAQNKANMSLESIREFWNISNAKKIQRNQKGANVPYRNCDPDSSDAPCHTVDVSNLWAKVRSRLHPKSNAPTDGRATDTWVNVTMYENRRTNVHANIPDDKITVAASDPEQPSNEGSRGGSMLFNLWDDRGTSVSTKGMIESPLIHLPPPISQSAPMPPLQQEQPQGASRTPISPAASRNPSVYTITYPPPVTSIDPESVYPPPNPNTRDLKVVNTLMSLEESRGGDLDNDHRHRHEHQHKHHVIREQSQQRTQQPQQQQQRTYPKDDFNDFFN